MLPTTPATPLTQIDSTSTQAKPTGIGELDRVLGGGVVPGSVVLLAGEPGVGKIDATSRGRLPLGDAQRG